MRKGEIISLIRKGYRITYIKPCTSEKGKRMAEVTFPLKEPMEPHEMRERLRKGFRDIKYLPSLGMVKIISGGMVIMVFASGKIDIRRAESMEDVVEAAEKIVGMVSA